MIQDVAAVTRNPESCDLGYYKSESGLNLNSLAKIVQFSLVNMFICFGGKHALFHTSRLFFPLFFATGFPVLCIPRKKLPAVATMFQIFTCVCAMWTNVATSVSLLAMALSLCHFIFPYLLYWTTPE